MGCWSEPTTKDAYRLSWASLVITIVAALSGFLIWKVRRRWDLIMMLCEGYSRNFSIHYLQRLDSSLALVFAFENLVDFLSSAVVLWRFFAPSKLSPELEQKLSRREQRASVAISFVLVLLGILVISAAANDFKKGAQEELNVAGAVVISFFSAPVFGVLAVLKFRYANRLDSPSLYKYGLCSLLGTILAVALFFNTIIIENNPSLEWIDPFVAMVAGFFAMFLGVQAIYQAGWKEDLPIFTAHWWVSSQGDGSNEMSGRPKEDVEMAQTSNSDQNDDMEDAEII